MADDPATDDAQDSPAPPAELEGQPLRDHIHNLVSAGLNAVPIVGGSLASLFDDYVPKRKEEMLREFIRELASDVGLLRDRLAEDANKAIETDDFAYLFERALRGAVESYQQEKKEAYRAILVNSLLPGAPDEDKKLFFLSLIDALTPLHFRILRILRDPVAFDERTGRRVGPGGGISTSIGQILKTLMPEYEQDILYATCSDLTVRGIASLDSLNTMITDRGIEQLNGRMTPLGKQFVDFITLPKE